MSSCETIDKAISLENRSNTRPSTTVFIDIAHVAHPYHEIMLFRKLLENYYCSCVHDLDITLVHVFNKFKV